VWPIRERGVSPQTRKGGRGGVTPQSKVKKKKGGRGG
jgi:hypothetical protein